MFKNLPEDEAVLIENGVYRTAKIYQRSDGSLFAQAKGGFVRLKADGSTSHDKVRLETLHREAPLFKDRFGRLCTAPGSGRTEVQLIVEEGEPLRLAPK